MSSVPSAPKRSPKPTNWYEEMRCAVEQQRLRLRVHPHHRGKNAALKLRLLAAEPAVLPPPLPSNVSKTGFFGVVRSSVTDHSHRNRKPYQARIFVGNAGWVHLGSYDTAEEAGSHAAAAHNALLLEELPPLPVEAPVAPPPRAKPHKLTMKFTKDEDERLVQIMLSPEFDAPLNRRGGICGGASKTGDEAYWRRVAQEMGYENSVKGARRCSRRWWHLNPQNADRLEEKRSHERKRKRVQTKSRAARQKCLAEALDNLIFDIDEDPFESALAITEETAPVEEAQNVVHLSQLKTPIDSPNETDLYTDEALSDIGAKRWSDISDLDFLDDFENTDGFYQFYGGGGFSKRMVKRTRTPDTKARQVTFTFGCSNLGRVGLIPLMPALVPAPEAPLVQSRMNTYLKVCKVSAKAMEEEVDWARCM